MPYWGIFPFRMRFPDLHGGHMLDDWWFHVICASDLSRTWCHTGAYFPFQMWFIDLHLCRMIDDRWFHVARFLTCHTFDAHTGAYFRFDWDLRIFMELHAHPHLRDTHWHDVSSVEPLGSYPVRPALCDASMSSCFPSGRRPFDLWVWFSCTRGWLGSRIRWRVIWAHLVFLTYHTLCLIALMWAILGMDSRAF